MKKSTESTQKTTKTRKKDELIELSIEYRNRMAEEKLKKLTLANSHQEFDLEKKKDSICYKAVAVKEFEKAIGDIYARIKNADEQLCDRLQLNIQQASILHDYMEQLLEDLSNIEIELDSTENFDADNYFAGKARRSQMLATE
jgi:hypothetical protein